MDFSQTAIAKVEKKVCRDHKKVQYIKVDDQIILVKELVQDACDITEDDDNEKERAFSFHGPGYIGFVNGKRPCGSKTKEHKGFKDTHTNAS